MSMQEIVLNVNNVDYELKIQATASLADVLREELGFTGTKIMCNEGECGACTVLIDGTPALSCMMLAVDGEGKEIRALVGYMPENDSFIAGMTAVHFVRLMAELSGLPPEPALERAHETLFYVGLGEGQGGPHPKRHRFLLSRQPSRPEDRER